MKYLLGLFLSLLVIVLIGFLGFIWWQSQLSPVLTGQPAPVRFVVRKDQTGNSIVSSLYQTRLIRSSLATKIYLRLSGSGTQLRPGGFSLSPHLSTPEIIKQLQSGPKDIWVTIPEGWRREQIAQKLKTSLDTSVFQFNTTEFLALTTQLEGQLFPDTYLIPQTATPQEVISLLMANFQKKSTLKLPQDLPVLILASLVEREAATDSDRLIIAGILKKRLEANWPLQIDATVQYAADTQRCQADPLNCTWWQPPTSTDIPSVFNTYLHPGLPPTPIANPGASAISASRQPQNSPYWYYLTDHDGVTHYAVTLNEHQSNIDKYLRL